MRQYLDALESRTVNFDVPLEQMTVANGWTIDGSHDEIGTEPEGPPVPDGVFARAKQAIINYDFSDPSIVTGHFDPATPVVGRNMLLEIKVLGFRFLNGVRVHSVRDEYEHDTTYFGFRYDTLEGHIEQGFEWFLLTKDHATGGIHFKIEAHWRLGDFPNLWSKVGFKLIGEHYRTLWRIAPRNASAGSPTSPSRPRPPLPASSSTGAASRRRGRSPGRAPTRPRRRSP